MQMRNKGFGPEEGFAKDLVYYKWGPKTEKIPVSSFEYIQFILEWADDCLNDDQIYTQYGLGMPGLEREIVKPICERILEYVQTKALCWSKRFKSNECILGKALHNLISLSGELSCFTKTTHEP
mmetsp:Transcript_5907/g.7744  ORF Transcript_5907/g.7744 Transcript_5907/m.7744 type:complete len:124 (-) Transcript_5907:266-637(-)